MSVMRVSVVCCSGVGGGRLVPRAEHAVGVAPAAAYKHRFLALPAATVPAGYVKGLRSAGAPVTV